MDTIRAIIFDLDGVICFTDNYHYQAWKELADAEGIYSSIGKDVSKGSFG